MTVRDLVRHAHARGITDFGLTDHIHTPYNLPDLARSRAEYAQSGPSPRFHFGVEVSCVSQWEIEEVATGRHPRPVYGLRTGGPPGAPLAIGLTEAALRTHGVEYVVGGTHWPMYVPFERDALICEFHRQNLFLATHPLVDIVAHPWWWHGHWQDAEGNYPGEPWLGDFGRIPRSMHDEFAAAALAHDAVVEINLSAMLLNPHYPDSFARQYLDYLAMLKSRGVKLCLGSDCHSAHYEIDFETGARMLDSVGIEDAELWRLPPRSEGPA
jgi:histidinol phosphatase-like PHP family hydrolase